MIMVSEKLAASAAAEGTRRWRRIANQGGMTRHGYETLPAIRCPAWWRSTDRRALAVTLRRYLATAMGESGAERVWILGAGFSRSLGGPLLHDLLSLGEFKLLEARFSELAGPCSKVFSVYNWGRQRTGMDTPVIWPNAESFLEFLDGADPGASGWSILFQALSAAGHEDASIEEVRLRARQAITASCWGFVKDKPRDVFTEAWMPYERWYGALRPGDVIITFNYDQVVERAAEDYGTLSVVTLGPLWISDRAKEEKVRLLKLHGSVNWKSREPGAGDEVPVAIIEPDKILVGSDESIIAHPGVSKVAIAKNLRLLWKYAEQALSDASHIYLLGYSMPPSDNGSKRMVLDALRSKGNIGGRRIHLVLGCDQAGIAAAARLKSMFEWNARIGGRRDDTVEIYPLNAEDFMLLHGAT